MNKILVAVCTYKRPKMLARCIESLQRQTSKDFDILIVNNDYHTMWDPKATFEGDITVFHTDEAMRGIAHARNCALSWAHSKRYQWICFIDDDETAHEGWVENLFHGDYAKVHIVGGWVINVPPTPTPYWYLNGRKPPREGDIRDTMETGNVRFPVSVYGAGFRFNTKLNLMGGEDAEFFHLLWLEGYTICKTKRAITYEHLTVDRCTLRWQLCRKFWYGTCNARKHERLGRIYHTLLWQPLRLLLGIVEVLLSPIARLHGSYRWRKMFFRGCSKVAKACGGLSYAWFGYLPQPYKNTTGD
jgi:succinoglycan biosynthesis protein ExoM